MLEQQGRAVDMRAVGRVVARGTRWAALTVIGFGLVAVGLAGLLLPVLPGWILIIAGFAVLSRAHSWAHSGLSFARKHAARSGRRLRGLATRRRRRSVAPEEPPPPAEVVIDLTGVPDDSEEPKCAGGEGH